MKDDSAMSLPSSEKSRRFVGVVLLGFLQAAVIGALAHDFVIEIGVHLVIRQPRVERAVDPRRFVVGQSVIEPLFDGLVWGEGKAAE